MGTVLSFSPRERRPIYTSSTTHHHNGSGTISTSNSTSDFQLTNYAYEQMNNAKNRENSKPMQYLSVPNQFQHMQNGNNSGNNLVLFGSGNSNNGTADIVDDRQSDSARILSEKNAIEKNLKKHSLFINALSWKRLSSSHGKKKLDSNGNSKSKSANISSSAFRPPTLTDTVHPMVVVNDKKKYPQQQVQLIASTNSSNGTVTTNHQQSIPNSTNYFNQGDHHKNLVALDLQNANLHHHHNIDKVSAKMSIPVRPIQLTNGNNGEHQQVLQAPRKTIIQVSFFFEFDFI